METHVKILGILNIALGALGILLALGLLAMFGGIAGLVGSQAEEGAQIAAPIIGAIGAVIFFFLLVVSIPGIIAGVGLLNYKSWARILTLVLSAINLFQIPFGTALGIYGFWVLLQPRTAELFERGRQVSNYR